MTRGHDAVRRIARQSRPSIPLCHSCLSALQSRLASTAASSIESSPIEPGPTDRASAIVTASQLHAPSYQIKASVVLSRPPILTRTLTSFEKAYFLYQRRLNERLALPFTRYFYYQKGTPGDVEWKRKIKERKTPARDIGIYSAYSDEGWNDELLVGSSISEPDEQVERLLKDAEVEVKEQNIQREGEVTSKEEVEKPMPRVTEADRVDDMRSLNRRLERTLYLVVKGGKGGWNFPGAILERKESLHTGAERIIVQTGGLNMNTWVVGNMPVGHLTHNYGQPIVDQDEGAELRGEKNFFMKARIMAGQANLKDNKLEVEDFQWLTKEEIQMVFHQRDWSAVKNILSER